MKILITVLLWLLKPLQNIQGSVPLPQGPSLRDLYGKKDALKKKMTALWERQSEWSKEDRQSYNECAEQAETLAQDIKNRALFEEQFKADRARKPETRELDALNRKASVLNILLREVSRERPEVKIDPGPIDEVSQERIKKYPQCSDLGGTPVRMSDFAIKKERATITTAENSGGALVEETITGEIVPNLYEQSWTGRVGVEFIENWRGDFLMPAEDAKPASGFVAEGADLPESSITFKNAIKLSPLRVGTTQPFTMRELLQDKTQQLENRINMALQAEWAKKVDGDFMSADGNPATEPKGILEVTGIQSKDASDDANEGAPLTFALIKDCQTLLEDNNQTEPGTWIINAKVAGASRKILRNNVAGALYIMTMSGGMEMFGDMRKVVTNLMPSNKAKGTSTADLSYAALVIPSSIVVVHWAMPTLSIDRSIGFKSDTIHAKISGLCNIGLRRAKDVVVLKNLTT